MLILQRPLAISFLLSLLITFVGPLRKIRRKKLKRFLLASGNSIFIQHLKGRFLTTAHAQRARRYNASIIFPWFSPDWFLFLTFDLPLLPGWQKPNQLLSRYLSWPAVLPVDRSGRYEGWNRNRNLKEKKVSILTQRALKNNRRQLRKLTSWWS